MNTLRKLSITALLAGLSLASIPSVQASPLAYALPLPAISSLTAEVGARIVADLKAELRSALNMPLPSRTRRSPTVSVAQMETVVVVATRLPPEGEGVARTAQLPSRVRF